MGDFDRLKKNIFILNFHLHKKDGANMIQNFIQNNHGVSTVNHVTHGHINAGKSDVLGAEPFIDSYTEPALNNDLKISLSKQPVRREKGQMEKNAKSHMRSVQKKPQQIKNLFLAEPVKYAS